MNRDVIIAFGVFQFTFLLLDIYILLKTSRDIARKGEYTWFKVLIFTHIFYLILNSVWTMNEYDVIKIGRPLFIVLCAASLWTVTNCATSFFMFVMEKLQVRYLMSGVGRVIRQIPAFLTTVLIISSVWTGWVFGVSEEGYLLHGVLYLPMMIVASLYLLFVAAIALFNIFRERTAFLRRANGALLASVLLIILFIAVDDLISKASILPAAVFAVIIIIFITMQESNINTDALTGMNNRRKAEEFLTETLAGVSDTDPVYLYLGDMDGFKTINDTYGHIEGDEALILCGRAIRHTIAQADGFAARFGGDEFLIVWQPKKNKDADPESLILEVNGQMERESEGKPYKLKISMGYVRCTDPKLQLSDYLGKADEMLYRKNAEIHNGNSTD